MSSYNADEVLAMAEQIERNGSTYYAQAAGIMESENIRLLLEELARWETTHEAIFRELRLQFQKLELETPIFDPEDEVALYLQAIADGHVFDARGNVLDMISAQKDAHGLLSYAMKMEKDSIIFYLGLKNLVPTKAGKEKVDEIIVEEMKHLSFLSRELSSLPS